MAHTETEDRLARARKQGKAQYDHIAEMVADLTRAEEIEAGDFDWEAEAEDLGFVKRADGWGRETAEAYHDAETACRSLDLGLLYDHEKRYRDADDMRQRIEEDPLSVQVRSGWHTPGAPADAEEYEILLCTGGPACRIVGDLDGGEPTRARIEVQDWYTSWEGMREFDEDVLLTYARCFYYGE